MRYLGNTHVPKGTIISPANRAIVRHIRLNDPCTPEELSAVFKGHRDFVILSDKDKLSFNNPKWLSKRLHYLHAAGHLTRNTDAQGKFISWSAVEAVNAPSSTSLAAHSENANIVPPRQVDVMHGPVYRPEPVHYRAGSMDHLAIPSLQLGRREPFRTSLSEVRGADHG